ncbi:MAG TPA: AAA family ATPase [Longimicrobium sp.]|nr:AAA family ATPase [Longimicrobium sp.]
MDGSARPLSLFVGRHRELATLRTTIHSAGQRSSRQAVAGSPGVGKTTLVQELKGSLLGDGYLTTDAVVPVLAGDSAESLFARVLSAIYETIVVNRPMSVHSKAMQDAQVVVRAERLGTGGGSVSVLGFGAGMTRGATVLSPKDILIDGPRILRDLMLLVRELDARGVILHLNNLENLSESSASRAAEVLRSLRDPMLMHDALHVVMVGTTEAVNTVVNAHAQVRTVFGTLVLGPLEIREVHRMLAERYAHLALGDRQAVAPVTDDAVEALYQLFGGDLRGLLKALEDGVTPLIGIAGTQPPAEPNPVRPLTIDELRPVLQQRYAAHLASLPEQNRVQQLTRWGQTAPDELYTQKSLKVLWNVSQPAVSGALSFLTQQGYVVALPRNGAGPTQYALSGVSRLVFG